MPETKVKRPEIELIRRCLPFAVEYGPARVNIEEVCGYALQIEQTLRDVLAEVQSAGAYMKGTKIERLIRESGARLTGKEPG